MRSPADRPRVWIERGLRATALALLAWGIWRVASAASRTRALRLDGATVAATWPALLSGRYAAANLSLDGTLPSDTVRALLAASAHAGILVRWSSPVLAPVALAVEALREPEHPVLVRAIGVGALTVRDPLATLDSLADGSRGTTITTAAAEEVLRAQVTDRGSRVAAHVRPGPPPELHAVLVLGRASWDTKFTVAALEEQGWRVETRIPLAPGAVMTSGNRSPLDTAHYAAVVAIDSTAADDAAAIVRFVRAGGGLVTLGEAARLQTLRALLPATPGARQSSLKRTFDARDPLGSLAIEPLDALRDDAVALDRRGNAVTVAARRDGEGRVLLLGYDESWRWRLEGGDDAVEAHRRWWSHLVGAVAATSGGPADGAEGAPVARWIDALGPSTAELPDGAPVDPLPRWLLPVLCGILLAEWGSRRLRGAR